MLSKVKALLGLGQRAGRVVSGSLAVRAALEKRQAKLLVIATDASAGTCKEFKSVAERNEVPILVQGTKDELGLCLGKARRAAVAVTDAKLAAAIRQAVKEEA